MPINDISLISIPVTDQDRARQFYVDVLGFVVEDDEQMGEGMRWLQVAIPGGSTTIALVTWFPTMPPGSIKGSMFDCDDIDATYQELEARGVQFAGPIQDQPWGRYAEFDDPDGNGWLLVQPSERGLTG